MYSKIGQGFCRASGRRCNRTSIVFNRCFISFHAYLSCVALLTTAHHSATPESTPNCLVQKPFLKDQANEPKVCAPSRINSYSAHLTHHISHPEPTFALSLPPSLPLSLSPNP